MFELVAESPDLGQPWKHRIEAGTSYTLGRAVATDLCADWDPHISREHVRVTPTKEDVEVERLSSATNPVFFGGEQVDRCRVRNGEQFVLGSTSFRVLRSPAEPVSPGTRPVEEVTFNRQDLKKIRFRDADKRIEVLTHLPEVIWGSRSDEDLYHRLVNLLLAGVPAAEAVAVVKIDKEQSFDLLHWERRQETAGEFRPSSRLVADALKKRKKHRSSRMGTYEPE